MEPKETFHCPNCSKLGIISNLQTYQINLEEAFTMCPNTEVIQKTDFVVCFTCHKMYRYPVKNTLESNKSTELNC